MSSDDVLTQAAQRARELWPGPIGDCVAARLEQFEGRESVPEWRMERAQALADAVITLSNMALQPVSTPNRDEVVEQWAATWDGVDRTPLPERPQPDALTDTLREAFNTAYERSDNPRVDTMHRHDQHQYAGACHVCRGDVAVLVPHIADRLISAGLVRTPVTAEQIEQAAQALHDDPTSKHEGLATRSGQPGQPLRTEADRSSPNRTGPAPAASRPRWIGNAVLPDLLATGQGAHGTVAVAVQHGREDR